MYACTHRPAVPSLSSCSSEDPSSSSDGEGDRLLLLLLLPPSLLWLLRAESCRSCVEDPPCPAAAAFSSSLPRPDASATPTRGTISGVVLLACDVVLLVSFSPWLLLLLLRSVHM